MNRSKTAYSIGLESGGHRYSIQVQRRHRGPFSRPKRDVWMAVVVVRQAERISRTMRLDGPYQTAHAAERAALDTIAGEEAA